ncbi:right-handed parallel beta-helix repeat-containing protein [Parvularcula lutaonensis]|uniref:Right-handed parallel beta-helix repeat-containing protein n=1 Tax=Parvularcula lutaonensis TaxID=491923 RepID=A0ABV7M8R5_9PROT|nr:right-handed parallel beta-helix repeat-containing protein [Parvularcula lutaonensis]GGY41363.1 hypothetical protein GCM10007148_07440 [Parvularcula lutaonensis]
MGRNITTKALLAGAALAFAFPSVAAAQIGGFDTEIKKEKKAAKPKKQDIVYVSVDPRHPGPKSVSDALDVVKEGGEIIVHPGVYRPENIKLRKTVSIRGIRDDYGKAPTLTASGGCLSVSRVDVQARVSDLVFRASDQTCISVTKGSLELIDSEIRGKHAGYGYQPQSDHLRPFNEAAAIGARSALVSIKGGRVRIANSVITGGETGVKISPVASGNGFEHVELQNNVISQMIGAGVVMTGSVDATLANNTIVNNQMSGIVYSAEGHARLVGNIISNNAYNGLYVSAAGDAISIERNKIHGNTEDGIEVRSGTAILVGNEIGEHNGCRVNRNAFAEGTSGHLAKPPITLLADLQGVNTFDASATCKQKPKKKQRSGRRTR